MDKPSQPGTRPGGRTCKAHGTCLRNLISIPPLSHPDPRPTLLSRRTPRPFKSSSWCHGPNRLRLAVAIRLTQPIRDIETPSAHVSEGRYLRRYLAAHTAIPRMRCGTVAEHRDLDGDSMSEVAGLSHGQDRVSWAPIAKVLWQRGQSRACRDIAGRNRVVN